MIVSGEPLYWKVPTPGRLPSGEPANEEPASNEAEGKDEAERAHDLVSRFRGRRCAVVVVKLITMGGFARDAPKAENGFIFRENCFVLPETTKHSPENPNHFR